MSRAATIFLIIVFLGSSFSCLTLGRAATGLPEEEIRSIVRQLIDSKGAVYIEGIKIGRVREGELSLEIFANLGTCWGKEEFARVFALEALRALFLSSLPLTQVTLNVREKGETLLTVSLGKNQAEGMDWEKDKSPLSFYERLRSRMQYTDDPADACWLIEKKSGGRR